MSEYDFERYLNIRGASSPSIGPDGERVAYLANTTGVPQVWALEEPGSWPNQLTFYDERVTFASWSPERDELIFGMDEGGNERAQLFRLDGDGETIAPLTAMPDAKHRWGGWNSDGTQFAFTSNRRDEAVFDVYVQDRDATGDEAELVHEGDGWLTVSGWSPDDDRLVVTESYSSFDQDLSVLDLETGEVEHVTPHEGNVRFQSVNWGPKGDSLYLVTDSDADTLYFARLDLETLDIEVVEEGGSWNVERVVLDEETGRLAYWVNEDGYSELTVGELAGETTIAEFPTPNLPRGLINGFSFGPDAAQFAVSVTGSTQNSNVSLVETETGDAEQWTEASTAGIPRETFVRPKLVHYETFDGRRIPAFFSLPSDAADGETPVIVDIHGGPESQRRPFFNPVKQYFLNQGYAVFEPNVRGSSGYGREYTHLDDVRNRMDSVADIKAGVEWLHDQRAVDPDRIVAYGGSYGGFMVLASLTEYPDLWAAGVDIVGIASFVTFLENTGDWRRSLREAEYGSLEDDREFLEEISPINNIERIDSPLLVLHGENDPRVPVGEAEQIAERAAAQGVSVEKLIFPDEGHGFTKLENRIEAYTTVAEFLDKHV